MRPQNCVNIGQKIFKIKILDFQIQCTNFLQFNREDFLNLFAGILAAIFLYYIFFLLPLILISLYFFPKLLYVYILYCIWIVVDRKTVSTCGRKCSYKWFRKNPIHVGLKNYFSTKLIKTSELHTGQNYLLAAYPHTVLPMNTLINFLSDANNIAEVFPQIDFCGVSHDAVFFIPLLRELMLAIGMFACNETSLKRLLTSAPSKGVIIYPGGASEMCHAGTGSIYRIIMSNRKGFIRVALITGTSLVPVFNFGEINILEPWIFPNPLKLIFKRISTQISMTDLVIPKGRGIFQTHFGFIPKQHPVIHVVGKPIHVPKVENPSLEIIDEYHKKFFDALSELFEEYKHTCDVAGADAKLIML